MCRLRWSREMGVAIEAMWGSTSSNSCVGNKLLYLRIEVDECELRRVLKGLNYALRVILVDTADHFVPPGSRFARPWAMHFQIVCNTFRRIRHRVEEARTPVV